MHACQLVQTQTQVTSYCGVMVLTTNRPVYPWAGADVAWLVDGTAGLKAAAIGASAVAICVWLCISHFHSLLTFGQALAVVQLAVTTCKGEQQQWSHVSSKGMLGSVRHVHALLDARPGALAFRSHAAFVRYGYTCPGFMHAEA